MGLPDQFKIPIERTVYFIAALIPGGVAILIYQSAAATSFQLYPGATGTLIHQLFAIDFLGYKTKLGLLVLAAFAIGHTLTNLVRGLLDDLVPMLGELIGRIPWPTKASFEHEDGPWRSIEWRNAIKTRLGNSAPKDLRFVTLEMMNQQHVLAERLPEEQRAEEWLRILRERADSILNDMEWSSLYSQYHRRVVELHEQAKYDEVTIFIRDGLTYNFFATALYVLASAAVVPAVRHWWCILPSLAWIFSLMLLIAAGVRRAFANKWFTLNDQISYLSSGQI